MSEGFDNAFRGPTIRVESVTKTFGPITALNEVSLVVRPGTIHAVLGPNGAGKTTLLRLVAGLSAVDGGEIRTDSVDRGSTRTAYLPEEPALYDYLTAGEFLTLARHLGRRDQDNSRRDYFLDRFELRTASGSLIKTLSAGTRRKVALAAALIQEAELIILDEPTNGLDTAAVIRLKEELGRLRDEGATVLLSTHILDFAAALCDRVTLLNRGRVVFDGNLADLPEFGGRDFERRVAALLGI